MDTQDLEKIKKFAFESYLHNKGQHNIHHAERVSNNTLKIADILGLDHKIDRNLLSASGYLHDILKTKVRRGIIPSLYNYFFEKSVIRKHIGSIVKRFDLPEDEFQILTNAIINHPYSIPYRKLNKRNDIYSKILQDADSIDYISDSRLTGFNKINPFLTPLSEIFVRIIKKNVRYFLNYPEIAQKMELFEK